MFPRFPLSCWSDDYLHAIKNGFGKYLDSIEPKGFDFSCVKYCIKEDVEKEFTLEINLT